MSETPGGGDSFFVSWHGDFQPVVDSANKAGPELISSVSNTVGEYIKQAQRLNNVPFDPLGGAFEKVSSEADRIENRLNKLRDEIRKAQANNQELPANYYTNRAKTIISEGVTNQDTRLVTAAKNAPVSASNVPLSEIRTAAAQGAAQGGAERARAIQSELLKELKGTPNAAALGSANSLRAASVLPKDVTAGITADGQTIGDFRQVLKQRKDIQEGRLNTEKKAADQGSSEAAEQADADKKITNAKKRGAKAAEEKADAEEKGAAKAKEAANESPKPTAGGSGKGGDGNKPSTPTPSPAPDEEPNNPQIKPPTPTPEQLRAQQAANARAMRIGIANGELEDLKGGYARERYGDRNYVSSKLGVLDPERPSHEAALEEAEARYAAALRKQEAAGAKWAASIESAAANEKKRQDKLDRAADEEALHRHFAAQNIRSFNEGVESKQITDLGNGLGRERSSGSYVSRELGPINPELPQNAKLVESADKAYERVINEQIKAGNEAVTAETRLNAQRLREEEALQRHLQMMEQRDEYARQSQRLESNDPTLRQRGNYLIDSENPGAPRVQKVTSDQRVVDATQFEATRVLGSETRAATLAEERLARARNMAASAAIRAEEADVRKASQQGLLNNFLSGVNQNHFGGGGSFAGNFDGLARSAGQTAKYAALGSSLYLVTQAAHDMISQFLDANDSFTELDVAMGHTTDVSGGLINALTNVAAVGGFNVGEAMDVAASGIRAFKDETDGSQESIDRLGASFAGQSARMAVLAKTSLADAAGNLKAITNGFGLAPNAAGFAQANDAVAGAKLLGGGDEQQISQGLANSALIFKQLGFSLNESAALISKINASTDESGTLIASRLSRLSSIIGGTTGRNFINQLNLGLGADQKVDTQASVKDQLVQIGKLYKDASTQQKGQIVSALGGTANTRELIITLQQIGVLTKEADKGFDGAATREFEERLKNVRAQLTQIKGNITAIITSVANSGVAAPIFALVEGLRGATSILREVTGLLNLVPKGFIAAASSAGVFLVGLRAIRAVQEAGGIGKALVAMESRVSPTRGLARQELSERAKKAAQAGAVGSRQGIGGRFTQELSEASGKTKVTLDQLQQARQEVEVKRNEAALERRDMLAGTQATPGRASAETLLAGEQAKELAAQEARVVALEEQLATQEEALSAATKRAALAAQAEAELERQRSQIVAARTAGLARIEAEAAAVSQVANATPVVAPLGVQDVVPGGAVAGSGKGELSGVRDVLPGVPDKAPFVPAVEGHTAAEVEAANNRLKALQVEREAVEAKFSGALTALELERVAAEERIIAEGAAGQRGFLSRFGKFTDDAFGGIGKAYTGPRDEKLAAGASGLRAGLAGAGGLARGAGGLLKAGAGAAYDALGGPVGIAIAGALVASELKSAADQIHEAGSAVAGLAKEAQDAAPRTYSSTEYQDRLDAAKTARVTADEARSGIFGSAANFLTGGEGTRNVQLADAQIVEARTNLASVKAADEAGARHRLSSSDLGLQIDASSAETVATSFTALNNSGRSATSQMQALSSALDRMGQAAQAGYLALSEPERAKVAAAGSDAAVNLATQMATAHETTNANEPGATALMESGAMNPDGSMNPGAQKRDKDGNLLYQVQGFDFTGDQAKQVNGATNKAIQDEVAHGGNLTSGDSQKRLLERLKAGYIGIFPDKQKLDAVAQGALDTIEQQIKDANTPAKRMDAINALLTQAMTGAKAHGQETGSKAQLKALQSGGLDESGQVAAQTELKDLVKNRGKFVQDMLDHGATQDEINKALEQYDANITQAQIAAIQARRQTAQARLQRENQQAQVQLNNVDMSAPGADAKIGSIRAANFRENFTQDESTRDVQALTDLFSHSAQWRIDQIKKETEDNLKLAQDRLKKDREVLRAAEKANSTLPPDERTDLSPLQANVRRDKGDVNANQGALSDINTAESLAVKPLQSQIDAANAAANAAGVNNSATAARVQLQQAQANYEAAKKNNADDPMALAGALQQVNSSKRALSNAVLEQAINVSHVGMWGDSQLDAAKHAYDDAVTRLNAAKPGDDVGTLRQDKIVAGRNKDLAQQNLDDLKRQMTMDLTDPVVVADDAVKKARERLNYLRKNNAPADMQAQARLDLMNANNSQEAAKHNEVTSNIQLLEGAQRITHAQAIQQLENEHTRIQQKIALTKKGTNGYNQLQKELLETEKAIKDANNQLSGQFNLGDIKVPTVYEVRRSIAAQTSGAAAIANSNVTNNTTLNISGVETERVLAELQKMEKSLRAGNHTTKPRKV